MAGPFNAPGPGEAEIERVFDEPAFRDLAERGAPAFVSATSDGALIWANAAARRLLGAKLAGISGRLAASGPVAGPVPRLKRLIVDDGQGFLPLSFLTKRAPLAGHGGEVLVSAVLGGPPVDA